MINNKIAFLQTIEKFLSQEYGEKFGEFKGVEVTDGGNLDMYYIMVEKDGVESRIPCIDSKGPIPLDDMLVTADKFGNILIKDNNE